MKLYRVCYYDSGGIKREILVRSNGFSYALYMLFEKYPDLEGKINHITVALAEEEYID